MRIYSQENFDQIITSRLHANDFAQPQIHDFNFYKSKAICQIQSSIQAISTATTPFEFNVAIAQANAFINAALDYEFICLSEKVFWLNKLSHAVRTQTIEESA